MMDSREETKLMPESVKIKVYERPT